MFRGISACGNCRVHDRDYDICRVVHGRPDKLSSSGTKHSRWPGDRPGTRVGPATRQLAGTRPRGAARKGSSAEEPQRSATGVGEAREASHHGDRAGRPVDRRDQPPPMTGVAPCRAIARRCGQGATLLNVILGSPPYAYTTVRTRSHECLPSAWRATRVTSQAGPRTNRVASPCRSRSRAS